MHSAFSIAVPAHASSFVLPAETFAGQEHQSALTANLNQKNYPDAAALLDAMLSDEGDQLTATRDHDGTKDGGLISVAAWVEALPPSQKTLLATAYGEKFDATVRSKLDALERNPSTRPEEFYLLARRYRFSAVAAGAYVLAADRLLELGDLSAAHALYQLAVRGGWTPDDARAAQIELLRRLDEGTSIALFPSPATQPQAPSSIPGVRTVKPPAPYTGPIPFDAPWLDNAAFAGQPRFFPFAGDDKIFLTSPRSVIALKENGQVAWSNSVPAPAPSSRSPTPRLAVDSIEGIHRPPNYTPAILPDVYGRPQILIGRQPAAQAGDRENDFCLRAYRAADGKLLWTSENQPLLKDLSFAGTPAVSGQHTYAVALTTNASAETGDQRVGLMLIALETLTGNLRWQATLGTFTLPSSQRDAWGTSRPWDGVWEQSEPLVAGDAVYVAPNAGFVAAVGRLDGKLRWVRPYPIAGSDNPRPPRTLADLRREVEAMRRSRKHPPAAPEDVDPVLGERWRGTPVLCGSVLIAAPQDSLSVLGLDSATGRIIWSTTEIDVPTLIGQTATTALFAGPTAITAIEARNGQPSWRWEPPRGRSITGPAVVKDNYVLVPTTTTIVTLHADDGAVARESIGPPVFRHILNAEPAKRTLDDAGAGKAFGLPPQ